MIVFVIIALRPCRECSRMYGDSSFLTKYMMSGTNPKKMAPRWRHSAVVRSESEAAQNCSEPEP